MSQGAMQGAQWATGWRQRESAYLVVFIELEAELCFNELLLWKDVLVKLRSEYVTQLR